MSREAPSLRQARGGPFVWPLELVRVTYSSGCVSSSFYPFYLGSLIQSFNPKPDRHHLRLGQCLFASRGGHEGEHVQSGSAEQSQQVCQYSQRYRYLAHLVSSLVRCQRRSKIGCEAVGSIDF